ncbi:hypothetical protein AGMMS50267_00900 [Spirochaetia bacterium]|nr:hypothetical protein AGMMS50267_00900 [Spirochaetia bacterium]
MDLTGIITGSVAVLSLFVGLPALVLRFIYLSKKNKQTAEIEKLRYQKELLELEVEKEKVQLLRLEAENKKYDALIGE